MAIRIPESLRDALRDAEINISVELPNPKTATKADKDGSLSLSVSYDIGEIYKTASNVANAINDAIDNAVIEELLELNGYVKGCSEERTCTFSVYKTGDDHYPTCSACGYEAAREECEDYVGVVYYEKRHCPNCGAKVVEE